MTASAVAPSTTLSLPIVPVPEPAAAHRASSPAGHVPDILSRLPRRAGAGLVLTGAEHRDGVRWAWLLDGSTTTPAVQASTAAELAELQEMLRHHLAGHGVLESIRAAHRHLAGRHAPALPPISAALARQESGVLEVAVLGSATARMHRRNGPASTVVCRRPRRTVLETIGMSVEVATDPRDGRPTEVEVHRAPRPPRAPVPTLGADPRPPCRPGYAVVAAHLLESVHLRCGRGLSQALAGATRPVAPGRARR